jgi:hypothetical protein
MPLPLTRAASLSSAVMLAACSWRSEWKRAGLRHPANTGPSVLETMLLDVVIAPRQRLSDQSASRRKIISRIRFDQPFRISPAKPLRLKEPVRMVGALPVQDTTLPGRTRLLTAPPMNELLQQVCHFCDARFGASIVLLEGGTCASHGPNCLIAYPNRSAAT